MQSALSLPRDKSMPDPIDRDVRHATAQAVQTVQTGIWIEEHGWLHRLFTVSYTHLDVYKRQTQVRSSGGQYNGFCQQGGVEVLERAGFRNADGARVAREALELVGAAPCPSGTMDVILMPDQMTLQIHESIGHPLELDRILGDERNFAGTSFVTMDMFGAYQYGSLSLIHISYVTAAHSTWGSKRGRT